MDAAASINFKSEQIMKKIFFPVIWVVVSVLLVPGAQALNDDQDQPATLDADEFDMNFQTGVRIYRGNVVYKQGSIRLFADELVAYFKDGELRRAVARGNLAEFRQRPEDKDSDVVGVALRIEMDNVAHIVTLKDRAKVTQDLDTVTGKRIVYNLDTERVKVHSGESTRKPATTSTSGDNQATPPAETGSGGSTRPRIVIQPKK